jgi:hypothetical protein
MPGPNGGLREVNRRDVAALQGAQGGGQFLPHRRNKLAPRGHRSIRRTRAANEDDAGGEGVGAGANHAIA